MINSLTTHKNGTMTVTLEGDTYTGDVDVPRIGSRVVPVSHEWVGPRRGHGYKSLLIGFCDGPVGGNMDASVTRYHGWRGTTDDWSVYAHGLREVLSVRRTANGAVIKLGPDQSEQEL